MRVVRRVREVLRLQAEAVALPVQSTAGADERGIEEVPAVELYTRLGGMDLQDAAASRVMDTRRQDRRSVRELVPSPKE